MVGSKVYVKGTISRLVFVFYTGYKKKTRNNQYPLTIAPIFKKPRANSFDIPVINDGMGLSRFCQNRKLT